MDAVRAWADGATTSEEGDDRAERCGPHTTLAEINIAHAVPETVASTLDGAR